MPHEVSTYEDAGYSFRNDYSPDEIPLRAVVASRFAGMRYVEPSARQARQRIVAFFTEHLRDVPSTPRTRRGAP